MCCSDGDLWPLKRSTRSARERRAAKAERSARALFEVGGVNEEETGKHADLRRGELAAALKVLRRAVRPKVVEGSRRTMADCCKRASALKA
mmetsp:Transcript_43772/g.108305  ORF Transcript_43772/g.108305 Transcript_43772/m.108305 type:complete len:91 (+) Transcript_43772:382-654(+)